MGSVLASRSCAVLAAPLLAAFVLSGCGLSSEDAATEAAVQNAAEELRASIAEDSAADSTDEAVEESADEPAGGTSGFYTCEDVVPEVIALSEEQQGEFTPAIIEVYDVKTAKDRQQEYVEGTVGFPSGENQVMILRCRGDAALDTGEEAPIVFELLVDKKDQLFVFYRDA